MSFNNVICKVFTIPNGSDSNISLTFSNVPNGVTVADVGSGQVAINGLPEITPPWFVSVTADNGQGLSKTADISLLCSLPVSCPELEDIIKSSSNLDYTSPLFANAGNIEVQNLPSWISQSITITDDGSYFNLVGASPASVTGSQTFIFPIIATGFSGSTDMCSTEIVLFCPNDISDLPSSCEVNGIIERCGSLNINGTESICGLPIQRIFFQAITPVVNPVQGILFIEFSNPIASTAVIDTMRIGGITLNASDGATFGTSSIAWDNTALTQDDRDVIYATLSSGQPFDVGFTCPQS